MASQLWTKEVVLASIGFFLPLLAGKAQMDREAMISCWRGGRKDEFERSRRNAGITREAVYVQSTVSGDFVVVYWEAEDIVAAFKTLATSDDPFDRWFRDHVRDVHGVNVEDGFPPPEQIMDFARQPASSIRARRPTRS
jgi:hypothetical protein